MDRALMIRRWNPEDAQQIIRIFEQHDRDTDLPADLGVVSRTLYGFHDLYFHFVEGEDGFKDRLMAAVADSRFRVVDDQLAKLLTPYDPNLPSMAEAEAIPFYEWKRSR